MNLITRSTSSKFLIALTLLASTSLVQAKRGDSDGLTTAPVTYSDRPKTSWAIAVDNDLLVPGSRDQDYTYGFNLTYAGNRVERQWASLHQPLNWIDRQFGLDSLFDAGRQTSKIEYGLFGFTPENISLVTAQSNDRPYASLIYVSSSRESFNTLSDTSWQTTLTIGLMGLGIVGDLQQVVHSALGNEQPQGWDNQISDGGELTARYSVARQQLLSTIGNGVEVKNTVQGSVGYITEASWSISVRAGDIRTPWVSFNPELASYGEKSNPNSSVKVAEQYVWGGVSLKYRAYNAFLEGQFKDSKVSYDSQDINRSIVEAWLGYTMAFDDGYSFTYSLRGHSSELNRGNADRSVVWGGFLMAKTFGKSAG